ncbi:MAG: MBL fold metallo-hydrolase [Synergistaceae bacterium]|jgi:ribonuclease J|nr:MBL fold metallo-hydrolase [Synergistaceae bacterium]
MNLKIHRGTNQIGGNIIEIVAEQGDKPVKIFFDCGANLPPLDRSQWDDNMKIDGLTRGTSDCDALFITHYHSDHCGLMPRVNDDIPIYSSRETASVLRIISDFIDMPRPKIRIVEPGVTVNIRGVDILPIGVRHSARGAMMFLVKTEGQKLLYTGDFGDFRDIDYSMLRDADVMLCEGTNINTPGGMTEDDVEAEAVKIMEETRGNVFVLCSSTNIDRIAAIEKACARSERTLAIDPFMNAIMESIAPIRSIPSIGFVPRFMNKESPRAHEYLAKYLSGGNEFFKGAKNIALRDDLVFMVRPTMKCFIKRLDKYKSVSDSALIYSIWGGYKKTEPVSDFLATAQSLGMRIIELHASGHAYRREIEAAVRSVSPKTLIPIHTESSAEFKTMHNNVVLLKDGENFAVSPDGRSEKTSRER